MNEEKSTVRLEPIKYRVQGLRPKERDSFAVEIEMRRQIAGPPLWSVSAGYPVILAKDGEWMMDPIPSSRTEAHIRKARFASPEEALEAAMDVCDVDPTWPKAGTP